MWLFNIYYWLTLTPGANSKCFFSLGFWVSKALLYIYICTYTPVFKNFTTLKMYIKYVHTHLFSKILQHWKCILNMHTLYILIKKRHFLTRKQKIYIFNIYFQCCNIIKTGVHICIYLYTYKCIYSNYWYLYSVTQTLAESSWTSSVNIFRKITSRAKFSPKTTWKLVIAAQTIYKP